MGKDKQTNKNTSATVARYEVQEDHKFGDEMLNKGDVVVLDNGVLTRESDGFEIPEGASLVEKLPNEFKPLDESDANTTPSDQTKAPIQDSDKPEDATPETSNPHVEESNDQKAYNDQLASDDLRSRNQPVA